MPPLRIVHCVSLRAFYFSLQSHLEGVGGGRERDRGRTLPRPPVGGHKSFNLRQLRTVATSEKSKSWCVSNGCCTQLGRWRRAGRGSGERGERGEGEIIAEQAVAVVGPVLIMRFS